MAKTKTKATKASKPEQTADICTVNIIDKHLAIQINECNILTFKLRKNKINLKSYFLEHQQNAMLYGKYARLLDRMVFLAICSNIARDVYEGLHDSKIMSGIAGVWDEYTIYNIAAAAINIMTVTDTGDEYFTYAQYKQLSQAELDKLNPECYMAMSEYTPSKFYNVYMGLQVFVVDTIMGIMAKEIPTLLQHPSAVTDNQHITLVVRRSIALSDQERAAWRSSFNMGAVATDNMVVDFSRQIEKPLLLATANMLRSAGLSDGVVGVMLYATQVHVLFGKLDGKTLRHVPIEILMVCKSNTNLKVSYKSTVGEEFAIFTSADLAISREERYGQHMRAFLTKLLDYTVAVVSETGRRNTKAAQDMLSKVTDDTLSE